jgi:hypothetical protein
MAGFIDQDAAYGLGRSGEEVPTTVPGLGLLRVDEPEVSLVDQGRGLERLTGLLLHEFLGGQLAAPSLTDGGPGPALQPEWLKSRITLDCQQE